MVLHEIAHRRIARFIERLISPRRASPSRPRALSIIERKRRAAADGQRARSDRQSVTVFMSAAISCSTTVHFSWTGLSGSGVVESPKGSSDARAEAIDAKERSNRSGGRDPAPAARAP